MPRFEPLIPRGTSRNVIHSYYKNKQLIHTVEREFSLNYFTRTQKRYA